MSTLVHIFNSRLLMFHKRGESKEPEFIDPTYSDRITKEERKARVELHKKKASDEKNEPLALQHQVAAVLHWAGIPRELGCPPDRERIKYTLQTLMGLNKLSLRADLEHIIEVSSAGSYDSARFIDVLEYELENQLISLGPIFDSARGEKIEVRALEGKWDPAEVKQEQEQPELLSLLILSKETLEGLAKKLGVELSLDEGFGGPSH